MDVLFRFLSPFRPFSISAFLSRACFSASSSQVCRMGFRAIMLLWLSVRDSNRQIVLWLRHPTPGIFKLARAAPTSAWVTPSLMRRCLKRSANISSSRGSQSASWTPTTMPGPPGPWWWWWWCMTPGTPAAPGWWWWWWGGGGGRPGCPLCGLTIDGAWEYIGGYIWWWGAWGCDDEDEDEDDNPVLLPLLPPLVPPEAAAAAAITLLWCSAMDATGPRGMLDGWPGGEPDNWSNMEASGGPNPWWLEPGWWGCPGWWWGWGACIWCIWCERGGPTMLCPVKSGVWPYRPSGFINWCPPEGLEMSMTPIASALAKKPSSKPGKKLLCGGHKVKIVTSKENQMPFS